jgi:hypothetical protein
LALSIRQPWAWLIVHGYKDVENRTWRTNVRGRIGIHAGVKVEAADCEWVRAAFPHIPLPRRFDVGGIVGRATLVDCVSEHESDWFFGPFGFVVANAEPLPFMSCRGRLGFFRPEIAERPGVAQEGGAS